MTEAGRIILDGNPIPFRSGDSVAVAVLRTGEHPKHGGTICLAGDCGNCVATVDGIAWTRTCQSLACPGLVVERHPVDAAPFVASRRQPYLTASTPGRHIALEHADVDVVVIGAGQSGTEAAAAARRSGSSVMVLDRRDGTEVVAIYAGPTVIARTRDGMLQVTAREVVVATGAAELQPACPGNGLIGLVTAHAAEQLAAAGVDLGVAVSIGPTACAAPCTPLSGTLRRVEGTDRVSAVVMVDDRGAESKTACETVIVGLGHSPRDLLGRMTDDPSVTRVGPATEDFPLPAAPVEGTVCPCSRVDVADLDSVWRRGFTDLELVKRATLAGTGTCQGSACLPHVRAWMAQRSGQTPAPFTARPASHQITLAEAAAGAHIDTFRRTALHDEHIALGAHMDRFGGWWRPWHYGDHVAEYWAVREGVSLGDVSTLGKLVVSGADVVEFLERIYPVGVADIRVGRARYALLLDEGGHLIDDGMIVRDAETRFVLTFTSAGASHAEMWLRDWVDTWGLRVHILDRTMSLAAINVTGPLAGRLLADVGLPEAPRYLQHVRASICAVPCHVMRLSFTGEMSFELHHPVDRSVELWRALMAHGRGLGMAMTPHGLQALQGLRLEKGHVIVGMDTELDSTPRRLGMDWAVKMEKADFVGRRALARTAALPDARRLVGLTMAGDAPTEGSAIWSDGEVVGQVTSSFTSPALGRAVMLGWLKRAPFPDRVEVDGHAAVVVQPPFYDPEGQRARA